MNAIERLRRDHQLLRAKLDVIEASLDIPSETWFVLRELCSTLSRQLADHMRREEELVMRCRQAMSPVELAEVAIEHHDEPEYLRSISALFISEPHHALNNIRPALRGVIAGLRRHMSEEEHALFPRLKKALAQRKDEALRMHSSRLHETMTINRVIHDFPATRAALENLFVNIPIEGYYCLDEVAWRHGIQAHALLKSLEDAIASCACQSGAHTKQHEQAQSVNAD